MTSGDLAGQAGTPAPVAPPRPRAAAPTASGAADGRDAQARAASPADLCQDSDDLLTSRRGRLVEPLADDPRAGSGPEFAPSPVEEAGIPFSAVGDGAAAGTPSPTAAAPAAASPSNGEEAVSPSAEGEADAPVAVTEVSAPPAEAGAPAAADPAAGAADVEDATAAVAASVAPAEPTADQDAPAGDAELAVDSAEPAAGPAALDIPEPAVAPEEPGEAFAARAPEPAVPPDDPFGALPIPDAVEQAAAASSFAAWLPIEAEPDEPTLQAPEIGIDQAASAAPKTDAAEAPADAGPTAGVPLFAALGLGEHTNGHSVDGAPTGADAAHAAPTDVAPPSTHELETRELVAEMGEAAAPPAEPAFWSPPAGGGGASPSPEAPTPSPEAPAPTASVALLDPPMSVVAAPAGEAVIELPRAEAASTEAEPAAIAAPPAEPPAEPPAPPASSSPPPPPAAPLPEAEEEEGATMTIIEHLEELRKRITVGAISIVVGAIISWFFVPHFVKLLEEDVRTLGFKFVNLSPLGPLGLNIKLAFLGGLIIASPVVFYEIWAFVAPGLTRKERRYALPFSLIGGALFALGAATAIVIIPLALRFLVSFYPVFDLENFIGINDYIMFIALIAVIFGITFELPIFMVGFSLLGIVNSTFFIKKFKIALFIMYGVAMLITPGADFVSPLVLGTFLVALYWLGILLIRFTGR